MRDTCWNCDAPSYRRIYVCSSCGEDWPDPAPGWSPEVPTEPGWYWWWARGQHNAIPVEFTGKAWYCGGHRADPHGSVGRSGLYWPAPYPDPPALPGGKTEEE